MTEIAEYRHDPDRKVIPRWRSFADTLRLGELAPVQFARRDPRELPDFLTPKVDAWREHQTNAHACDVVGSAIVLGRQSEAIDAAKFLLQTDNHTGPWIHDLTSRIFVTENDSTLDTVHPIDVAQTELHKQVRTLRQCLHVEPRDPISWVDLARLYTVLGLPEKAEQSMNIALGLAKDNRFVLRSATRLWIHLNDVRRAHKVLESSVVTKRDPWLLAAEIATAEAASRTPKFIKVSRELLNNDRIQHWHTSELASALATLELSSGSIKRARKLFKRSLENPTENSIAQAAWASRRGYAIGFNDQYINIPNTFEARSWTYYQKGAWAQVLEACRLWLYDQPFSSRPGVHGSYVSAIALEDYTQSKAFAEHGLVANPKDPMLLNNLAFAQINLGETEGARQTLQRMHRSQLSEYESTTVNATQGLLAFRNGDISAGRQLYDQAITDAQKLKDNRSVALASTFYAIEELSRESDNGKHLAAKAIDALGRESDPSLAQLKRRLEIWLKVFPMAKHFARHPRKRKE